jgi:hypothetical protein
VPHVSLDEDPHSDITELNDEEDNDDDDKSDTEDDTVVDSVDTLPNAFLLSIGMCWRRNRMKLVLNKCPLYTGS